MNDLNKDVKDEKKNEDEKDQSQTIELDVNDYSMLLDRLEELESQTKGKKDPDKNEKDDLDILAEEGKKTSDKDKKARVSLDAATPTQLADMIRSEFSSELTDIKIMLHSLKLERDIERIMSKEENQDLLEYESEIFALMKENPRLSLERAYRIAKDENPEKAKNFKNRKGEKDTDDRRPAYLRSLPDPRRFRGEKPGAADSTTSKSGAKNLDDAAERAFSEVFEGKKT